MTVRIASRRGGTLFLQVAGLAAFLLSAHAAHGQGSIGADPYDPDSIMYRPFVYPGQAINPSLPNQGRLDIIGNGGSRRNSFQDYLDSGGASDDLFGRSGRGSSRFDSGARSANDSTTGLDRSYVPNRDDTFYEDQAERQRKYFAALREKDPKKRAAMLRDVETASRKATASLSTGRMRRESRDSRSAPEPANVRERASTKDRQSLLRPSTLGTRTGSTQPSGATSPKPGYSASARGSGTGLLRAPDPTRENSPSSVLRRSRNLANDAEAGSDAGPAPTGRPPAPPLPGEDRAPTP